MDGQPARVQAMDASLVSTGQGSPRCRGVREGFLEEATTASSGEKEVEGRAEGEGVHRQGGGLWSVCGSPWQ